jgi:hypothetical protein
MMAAASRHASNARSSRTMQDAHSPKSLRLCAFRAVRTGRSTGMPIVCRDLPGVSARRSAATPRHQLDGAGASSTPRLSACSRPLSEFRWRGVAIKRACSGPGQRPSTRPKGYARRAYHIPRAQLAERSARPPGIDSPHELQRRAGGKNWPLDLLHPFASLGWPQTRIKSPSRFFLARSSSEIFHSRSVDDAGI